MSWLICWGCHFVPQECYLRVEIGHPCIGHWKQQQQQQQLTLEERVFIIHCAKPLALVSHIYIIVFVDFKARAGKAKYFTFYLMTDKITHVIQCSLFEIFSQSSLLKVVMF